MAQTLGQMYLTTAWLEAIFYGINCMLFGYCMVVLSTASPRVILATLLQFALSTAHVIITLVQLFQAFTYGVSADTYYSSPHHSPLFIAGFYIYVINTYVQELLLIWRLYGLWGRRIKICIFPLTFWAMHVTLGTIAVSSFIPTTATGTPQNVRKFGLSGWGLETLTNLTANFGIAYRLWQVQRCTASIGSQRHFDYRGTMLLVIECGALITVCTIIMFGLYASGHEAGIVGVGLATQIATISPLIIVARVGVAKRSITRPSGQVQGTYPMPLEISVIRTENMFREYPMKSLSGKGESTGRRDVDEEQTL